MIPLTLAEAVMRLKVEAEKHPFNPEKMGGKGFLPPSDCRADIEIGGRSFRLVLTRTIVGEKSVLHLSISRWEAGCNVPVLDEDAVEICNAFFPQGCTQIPNHFSFRSRQFMGCTGYEQGRI